MAFPMFIFTLIPPLVLIGGYIYAGDWDSLIALAQSHAKEIIVAIEAVGLFIAGVLKKYKIGAMICVAILMTLMWRV